MITGGRFDGTITGIGTTGGTRFVLGAWTESPFGPITDVMIETADGHRVLIAPTPDVGRFIGDTYGFDEVRVELVSLVRAGELWTVTSESLRLRMLLGRRTLLGRLLALVPRRLARHRRCGAVRVRLDAAPPVAGTGDHVRRVRPVAAVW